MQSAIFRMVNNLQCIGMAKEMMIFTKFPNPAFKTSVFKKEIGLIHKMLGSIAQYFPLA